MSIGARYILGSVVCFSIVSLFVKSLQNYPFELLVFWRGFTCLGITYYVIRRMKLYPWGKNRRLLIQRGVFGTMALSFFFYTLHTMPLASAVTIQYLSPILTVLVAGLFFGEQVELIHWVSSFIGFLGVFVIQGFDSRVSMFDAIMGILGAMSSAIAYNSVRSLRDSDNEWIVMFYFPLIATLASFPFAVRRWVWPTPGEWMALFAIGGLTQLAQFFMTRGYQADKASKVASMNYVGVVLAVIYGIFIFHEPVPSTTALGIFLILVSVGLATKMNGRFKRPSMN